MDEFSFGTASTDFTATSENDNRQPPVTLREVICVIGLTVLSDVAIYRGGSGYAGLAVLMIGVPILLWLGSPLRRPTLSTAIVAALLLVLAVRLMWCGSVLATSMGLALLSAFATSLVGMTPFVLKTLIFGTGVIGEGHAGLKHYSRAMSQWKLTSQPILRPSSNWLAIGLPVAAVGVFGSFFVLANPDVLKFVSDQLATIMQDLQTWLTALLPGPTEILFWGAIVWLAVGTLRPMSLNRTEVTTDEEKLPPVGPLVEISLYAAFRNTLISVIGLFAIYLVFEFQTLWGREFPKGFHYSGYAHEGAAWLTVALGTATALLSFMFRGSILSDPREPQLRKLSWLWSLENLLLAVSVYHRLCIYIGFNGLTRMRMVAFLGITSVLVGFALVLWMIANRRNFTWLLRRQLWTVAFALYLYAVLPIDMWVNQYNVRRILAGHLAPCVQISVHPTSAEGLLQLQPLADHPHLIVRHGIRAILLKSHWDHVRAARVPQDWIGWTQFQLADRVLAKQVAEATRAGSLASQSTDPQAEFDEWAYQWY